MNDTVHPANFQLVAPFEPAGDQPQAITKLIEGFESGLAKQTLLGVTGPGKTYTIANVIQAVQKPTLVMAPKQTLAARQEERRAGKERVRTCRSWWSPAH